MTVHNDRLRKKIINSVFGMAFALCSVFLMFLALGNPLVIKTIIGAVMFCKSMGARLVIDDPLLFTLNISGILIFLLIPLAGIVVDITKKTISLILGIVEQIVFFMIILPDSIWSSASRARVIEQSKELMFLVLNWFISFVVICIFYYSYSDLFYKWDFVNAASLFNLSDVILSETFVATSIMIYLCLLLNVSRANV